MEEFARIAAQPFVVSRVIKYGGGVVEGEDTLPRKIDMGGGNVW